MWSCLMSDVWLMFDKKFKFSFGNRIFTNKSFLHFSGILKRLNALLKNKKNKAKKLKRLYNLKIDS